MRQRLFIFLFLAIFSFNKVFAQQSFVIKQFNSTNGLPQNSINGMQMDEHGYLWLATEGGIVKYDGNKFKTYKECGGKPIESDRIKGLAKTIKNEIIAYDIFGRIYKIKDNELDLIDKNKTLNLMGALPNLNTIKHLQCISEKNGNDWLYFQYPLHVFPLSEKKFVIIGIGGFYLYEDTTFISFIPTKGLKISQTFFMNGTIFFFDASKNIYKIHIENKNIEKIEMSGDILQNQYYTKTKTIEKVHWKISDNSVFMKLLARLLYKKIFPL
jgi:hypothetical protein